MPYEPMPSLTNMQVSRFNALLEQYITDTISKEDLIAFYAMLNDTRYRALWDAALQNEWDMETYEGQEEEGIGRSIREQVISRLPAGEVLPIRHSSLFFIRRAAAAAAAVAIIVAGFYWINNVREKENDPAARITATATEIQPGGNKAVLTLGNGKQIDLAEVAAGRIAEQGNIRITKKRQGVVTYEMAGIGKNVYDNWVHTPRGGQYCVVLADGTSTWLNAGSSIRFPTMFTGDERKVEVTGEVYFDVAPDKQKPFVVTTKGMTVQVLGTRFCVNAYDNEPVVKATLLQGSIKVLASGNGSILAPGQQAYVQDNKISVVKNVDTGAAVSWKNGYFTFEKADVKTVMRQVERWYDINVIYTDSIHDAHFNGVIPRNILASNLIQILNAGGISCSLRGNSIVIR